MKILIANDAEHRKTLETTGFWGKRGAGCLFKDKASGRFLFAHRSKHVEQPNTWGTWGGALDANESPEQGVRREIVEETKYTGQFKLIPLTVFKHSSGFQFFNYLAVVAKEFEPELDWETQDFRWVEFGKWPDPLHFGVKEVLSHPSNLQLLKTS